MFTRVNLDMFHMSMFNSCYLINEFAMVRNKLKLTLLEDNSVFVCLAKNLVNNKNIDYHL